MNRRTFLASTAAALANAQDAPVSLDPEFFRHYIDGFNHTYKEEVVNYIPDARAWEFLKANIPLFTCPDRDIEEIYYYRWWTYRKHIKETPDGFLVTEFLKPVKHAAEYNALSCAFGHHVAEGRWLRDPQFIDGDVHFWLRSGVGGSIRRNFHQFSGWAAAALYDRWLMDGRQDFLVSYLDPLAADYAAWEQERLTDTGLFWQRDVSDGMESSISGGRKVKNIRPSINSYMYGNAKSIAAIAELAGKKTLAAQFRDKAARLKDLTEQRLWNKPAAFFETRVESGEFAPVREQIGYTPWYFDLPAHDAGYEIAWKQLMDPQGFYAPYGPTTAERRNREFQVPYEGDDCQWNGPSWPFATTITLKALANVLNNYRQTAVSRQDYFDTFRIYTKSQHIKLEDGRVAPFVDEDQNPLTGEWLARAMKIRKQTYYGRGDHYNHSGYADLVVTGLAGLRPRADSTVEVNPLLPAGAWDWFCLDRIPYRGRALSIVWDKDGGKFGKGKGLRLFADGREIAHAPELARITGQLP
ncbi:MAG: MGH1-like glycoside hydrolase domain-containing protein [Bryobacteraceae bacterium]